MTPAIEAGSGRQGGRRIAAVDVARGAALIGMFVYHLTWDLGFFRFIDADIPLTPAFHLYAHAVASAFLFLVGVSLVLAARSGMNWGAYGERLVWIVACAAVISLGTWFLFPKAFIFFGILHCIAVASVLALPFLRLPVWVGALGAAASFVAPSLLASASFDRPSLWWIGLGTKPPMTCDYQPVLPWAGMVLLGVVVARLVLPGFAHASWPNWVPRNMPVRAMAWGGRHSLFVYIVHQPVILGILFLIFQITGPSKDVEARPFLRACNHQCLTAGAMLGTCIAACRCIVDRSRSSGLWERVLADRLSDDERGRFHRLRVECVRLPAPRSPPPPPDK